MTHDVENELFLLFGFQFREVTEPRGLAENLLRVLNLKFNDIADAYG